MTTPQSLPLLVHGELVGAVSRKPHKSAQELPWVPRRDVLSQGPHSSLSPVLLSVETGDRTESSGATRNEPCVAVLPGLESQDSQELCCGTWPRPLLFGYFVSCERQQHQVTQPGLWIQTGRIPLTCGWNDLVLMLINHQLSTLMVRETVPP